MKICLQCLVQAGNDFGTLNNEVTKALEEQINIVMNGIAKDCYKESPIICRAKSLVRLQFTPVSVLIIAPSTRR